MPAEMATKRRPQHPEFIISATFGTAPTSQTCIYFLIIFPLQIQWTVNAAMATNAGEESVGGTRLQDIVVAEELLEDY